MRESASLDTLGWCGGGGAQNESSVENGKAFCEKAAGEEVIISRQPVLCDFPRRAARVELLDCSTKKE